MGTTLMIIGIGIMVQTAIPFRAQPIIGLVVFLVGALMALLKY